VKAAGFQRLIPFGAAEVLRFLLKLCHIHTCVFWCSEVGFRALAPEALQNNVAVVQRSCTSSSLDLNLTALVRCAFRQREYQYT
jgi:hypothetical protein